MATAHRPLEYGLLLGILIGVFVSWISDSDKMISHPDENAPPVNAARYASPALSALPFGKDFSPLRLFRIPQDVGTVPGLQSSL